MTLSKRQKEELISYYLCGEPTYRKGQCAAIGKLIEKGFLDKKGLTQKGNKLAKVLADENHEKLLNSI